MEVEKEVTVIVICPDCGLEFEEEVMVLVEVEHDDFP